MKQSECSYIRKIDNCGDGKSAFMRQTNGRKQSFVIARPPLRQEGSRPAAEFESSTTGILFLLRSGSSTGPRVARGIGLEPMRPLMRTSGRRLIMAWRLSSGQRFWK